MVQFVNHFIGKLNCYLTCNVQMYTFKSMLGFRGKIHNGDFTRTHTVYTKLVKRFKTKKIVQFSAAYQDSAGYLMCILFMQHLAVITPYTLERH